MQPSPSVDGSAPQPLKKAAKKAVPHEVVKEQVGMRRWLRLTARNTATAKQVVAASGNPAADAAASALAELLKDSRKFA